MPGEWGLDPPPVESATPASVIPGAMDRAFSCSAGCVRRRRFGLASWLSDGSSSASPDRLIVSPHSDGAGERDVLRLCAGVSPVRAGEGPTAPVTGEGGAGAGSRASTLSLGITTSNSLEDLVLGSILSRPWRRGSTTFRERPHARSERYGADGPHCPTCLHASRTPTLTRNVCCWQEGLSRAGRI